MIDKSEVLALATDLSLAPDVIEKDYVLGWVLAGIYATDALASGWVFKGGTCLKKCYFETYRFSEDLDFTVSDDAFLEPDFLQAQFEIVGRWIYDHAGITLPADQFRFDFYRNSRGGASCEGRIYYNGPMRRTGSSLPRIKLDLTTEELIVLEPAQRPIAHPYSDLPEGGFYARCYAFEEVFGEKMRALVERTRPRDLYDVINLYRHAEFRPDPETVHNVVRQKCAFRKIPLPALATVAAATGELIADWKAMLGHQLPALPPFESFWEALPELFEWLETGAVTPVLSAAPANAEDEVLRPAIGSLGRAHVAGSAFLETIRFAAANHLCVDLAYRGELRRIEPYSLRRTHAGNIMLFAIRRDSGGSRSYRIDRIQGARTTNETFSPRFAIELSPSRPDYVPTINRTSRVSHSFTSLGASNARGGPTYIYECPLCGKKFRRSKIGSQLNSHTGQFGYPCHGRTGYLVDTKY